MPIQVERESNSTKSRHVNPGYTDKEGLQQLIGSDRPMTTADIVALRTFEGRTFAVGAVRNFSNLLPAGESLDIAIAWASGVSPRLTVSGLSSGNAEGFLYEGATVTGGMSVTAIALNRTSTNTSQSAVLIQPTVTNVGTLVLNQLLIGGSSKKAGGAEGNTGRLFLKPLTTYLFRVTNRDTNTAHAVEIILEWYE